MTLWWLGASILAVSLGAFVQSALGLGFGVLVAPLLLLGLEPKAAVVVVLMLGVLNAMLVLVEYIDRGFFRSRRLVMITPLMLGAVVGSPLGALFLRATYPDLLRLVVGFVVAVSGAFVLLAWSRPVAAELRGSFIAGLAAGLLSGGTGMSGPPVAAFVSNQGWSRDLFRLALTATFAVASLSAFLAAFVLGIYSQQDAGTALMFAPAVLVGWGVYRWVGANLGLDDSSRFRSAVGILILASGTLTIAHVLA